MPIPASTSCSRHLDALIERLGEDGVAFGSDFDGAVIPTAIGDAAGLPRLLERDVEARLWQGAHPQDRARQLAEIAGADARRRGAGPGQDAPAGTAVTGPLADQPLRARVEDERAVRIDLQSDALAGGTSAWGQAGDHLALAERDEGEIVGTGRLDHVDHCVDGDIGAGIAIGRGDRLGPDAEEHRGADIGLVFSRNGSDDQADVALGGT